MENEARVAWDLARRLTRLRYRIPAVAATGTEAIHYALILRPDVVLMDIDLPGATDGLEAAHAIRAQLPIPIVYLNADADVVTTAHTQETGAAGQLQKPVAEDLLHATLRQVLLPPSSQPPPE